MEDQRIQKQYFLRTEVLEKGYDPEEYQNHLAILKENGTDIDLWDFEELKLVTKRWTKEQDLNNQDDQIQRNIEKSQIYLEDIEDEDQQHQGQKVVEENIIKEVEKEKEQKVQQQQQVQQIPSILNPNALRNILSQEMGQEPLLKKYQYHAIYTSQKQEKSVLNGVKNLEVTIIDHEIVKTNIFTSSYALYVIKTWPFKWEVKRRYSDFLWLSKILQKHYPGYILPAFPEKTAMVSVDDDTVKKRKTFFEHFLNIVMKSPELLNSPFLLDFLKVQDKDKFKQLIDQHNSLIVSENYNSYKTMAGEIVLQVSHDNKKFLKVMDKYADLSLPLNRKIKSIAKNIRQCYEQISKYYGQMSETFLELEDIVYQLNESIADKYKEESLGTTYVNLSGMTAMIGNSIKDQLKHLESHFENHFTYEEYNIKPIKDMISLTNHYQQNFKKIVQQINQQGQLTQEFINFPTKDFENSRDQYAYHAHRTAEESSRFLKNQTEYLNKNFQIFSSINKSITFEMEYMWENNLQLFSQKINQQQTTLQQTQSSYQKAQTQSSITQSQITKQTEQQQQKTEI